MQFKLLAAAACLIVVQLGCTSMSSTMLTRDESNSFWTRKGGLKGVPITLKVPTHVQLTVFERHFLTKGCDERTYRIPLNYVVRDFSQEFIYTEKVFTVDFKRPASGTYNLHLDLTDDQYIQKFQHDVTDNTIQAVGDLVKQLAPVVGAKPAAGEAELNYEEIQSVVAVGVFEIDAPDFEEQMCAFVNCHLNQAHDAWVAPPDVKAVHRVDISGFKDGSNVCEGLIAPHSEKPFPEVKFNYPQTELRPVPLTGPAVPQPIPAEPRQSSIELLPSPNGKLD